MPKRSDQWYLDAYTGGGGFETAAYLIRHPRESDEKFGRRQELAAYPNFTRKVVGAYLGTLFRETASRSGEVTTWTDLQTDADATGGRIDDVMRRAVLLAMLLGTIHLVVDRPPGQPATRAEEARLRPYVTIRLPGDIEAQTLDALGRLVEVTYREQTAEGVAYRHWDAVSWWLARDPAGTQLIGSGQHSLGRVPVHRLHSTELLNPADARASAWAAGVAELNGDLYQLRSELRELLRSQTFSILTLPVVDAEQAEALKDMSVSTENAIAYNPTGGGKPAYIAPPPDPVSQYRDAIADTITQIYQIANLEFVGGVQQSGVALQFHFQAANDAIGLLAQEAERAEEAVGRLACAWSDQPWDGRVTYPRRFNVDVLGDELKEALSATDLGLGQTAEALIKGRIARRMLGDSATEQQLADIDRELAAAGDPYGDRLAKSAKPTGA